MYKRKRDVSGLSGSIRKRHRASLGERTTVVAPKKPKSTLESAKPVLVEWLDAAASDEWHEAKKEDLHCRTIGFVVYEDNQQIELAGTITEGMCNNSITIPKQMIIKRKTIQIETTKRKSKRKETPAVGTGYDPTKVPFSDH